MQFHRFAPLLFSTLLALTAQMPLTAQTPAAGITPAWDVRTTLTQIQGQVQRYKTLVDQLRVQQWVDGGAPDTYLKQQRVLQTEVGYLTLVTSRLADQPEKLSLALDAYFRLQSL